MSSTPLDRKHEVLRYLYLAREMCEGDPHLGWAFCVIDSIYAQVEGERVTMNFDEYQHEALGTKVYGAGVEMLYPALGLAGESGEVAEVVKKMLRDDGGRLTHERREKLKKELGDVLWYLAALAHDAQISLQDVAETNIAKLKDRQARDKIHGDGDDR